MNRAVFFSAVALDVGCTLASPGEASFKILTKVIRWEMNEWKNECMNKAQA